MGSPINNERAKIGLLGGSFNPPHEGHVHISKEALRLLGLDEVWWLVSPQNPLKSSCDMADFAERMQNAEAILKNKRKISVSAFEALEGTQYTYDTLKALQKSYPEVDFVWLMGADNLLNFHKWYKWQEIFSLVPIAVFDREDYAGEALNSEAARHFKDNMQSDCQNLAGAVLPRWCFVNITKHPASSTKIRNSDRK
jgi:nicotinate-nucleotide adenylyltransferase